MLAVLHEHIGVVRCLYIDDYKLVSGGDCKKIVIWDWRVSFVFHIKLMVTSNTYEVQDSNV
jgi:hypothetical protein